MRILKKSLALLLALTMVLSLVVINVSADGTAVIKFSKDKKLATNEAQTVNIVVSIQNDLANAIGALEGTISYDTDNLTLTGIAAATENAAAGYTHMHNHATKKAMVFNATDLNFAEEKNLFVLTFEIKANPTVGTYAINFVDDATLKIGTATGTSLKSNFTITAGEIEVYETKTITEFTPATATITYGANAEAVAAAFAGKKATGTGTTSSSAPVEEEFDVTWDLAGFDTTTDALASAEVNGTVAAIEGYTFTAQPTAIVTFEKATTGFTFGEVAYSTKAVKDGEELTEIEDIRAWITGKDDEPTTTTVTISAEGAAAPNVDLNWAAATKVDDADTLKTGVKDDTITLNVPVVATEASNVYYTLAGTETIPVTITILAAEIAGASVKIEGATTADDMVKVKATVPAGTIAKVPTGESYIHGAGYKAESADAKTAIEAMKADMGRALDDVETSDVDIKTMYVGLNNLEESAEYSVKVLKADGTEVDLSNTSMEYTAAKDEVVFYWTFNQESANAATEDVVDGGVYTIKAYKAGVEFDSIDVTVGEADVEGAEPVKFDGTFKLAIDKGAAVLEDAHTYAKNFVIGTDVNVTLGDDVEIVELKADKDLSEILGSGASVDDEFTVSVYYNSAALLVGAEKGVGGKVMAVGGGIDSAPGIGKPTNNPAPMTPVTPPTEEPGTEEPGAEEPGTEEPGTEEPVVDPSAPIEGAPFEDITAEYAWAAESIATLKDLGVVSGVDGANFEPDADITRAEFTKMVAVLFGLEIGAADTHFEDCAADEWYTPYIVAATEAGFINGINDTEFAPDATITREQACAILARALKAVGEGELTFTDAADVEEYAKAAIAALAEMGIINGYEDGSFAPANNITRAEAAKIMAGAYGTFAPAEDAADEATEEVVEEATEEVAEEVAEEAKEEVTAE